MTPETFVILERAGNGYLVRSTEGRDDTQMQIKQLEHVVGAPSGADDILSDMSVNDWFPVVAGTYFPGNPSAAVNWVQPWANSMTNTWTFRTAYTGVTPPETVILTILYIRRGVATIDPDAFIL